MDPTGSTTGLLVVYAKCIRARRNRAGTSGRTPSTCRRCARGRSVGRDPLRAHREATTRHAGIGFTHVTIYELDDVDVTAQAARDARRRRRPARRRAHAPAHATVGADVFRAHGPYGKKPEPSSALRGHILTYVLCNDPAREAEWDSVVRRAARAGHVLVRSVRRTVALATGRHGSGPARTT